LKALKTLKELAMEKAAGPTPSFTQLDLARAIEIIGSEHIGRNKLSARLGLGEGTTRTLIDRLLDARLIKISKLGCELTGSGHSILNELNAKLGTKKKVARSSVTVGNYNFGILVKGAANRIKSGIEQRDAAVRVGANGAVTFVVKHGELIMPPPAGSETKGWENLARAIKEAFEPHENDVIIIAGGDSEQYAEEGAMAAAWVLIG
jgi:DNA-binding transcriptional regulator LsrR (DeoR family)